MEDVPKDSGNNNGTRDINIFKFTKSYDQRLKEYEKMFATMNRPLSAHDIESAWGEYLELFMEPSGWEALWNMSRDSCDELNVSYPTTVIVEVEEISFFTLTACVSILQVSNDKYIDHLPDVVNNVPLKDLHVLKSNSNADAVERTAECIDQFRVFYNHLWQPWDVDSDNEVDNWVQEHLVSRLNLYYDLLLGKVHVITGRTIRRLIERGRNLHRQITELETEIARIMDDGNPLPESSTINMLNLAEELNLIKHKLLSWENPEIRSILNTDIVRRNGETGVFVVSSENTSAQDLAKYLQRVVELFGADAKIKKVGTNMSDMTLNAIEGDTIALCEGLYSTLECFDTSVVVHGLVAGAKAIVTDSRPGWCVLETMAAKLSLNDILLNVDFCENAVVVKSGVLRMSDVCVQNRTGIHTSVGITVYENAALIADNCRFEEFDVAIHSFHGSTVTLSNCVFHQNQVCIRMVGKCKLSVKQCDMIRTNDIPFVSENVVQNINENEVHPLEYLEKMDNVIIDSLKLSDNSMMAIRLL